MTAALEIPARPLIAAIKAVLPVAQTPGLKRSIPALCRVRLHAARRGGPVTIAAGNPDQTLIMTLPDVEAAGGMDLRLDKPVAAMLPILAAGAETVGLRTDGAGTVTIDAGGELIRISASQPDDLIKNGPGPTEVAAAFDAAELRQALSDLAPMASTEETRFYLNGILFRMKHDAATLVATDGHRLGIRRLRRHARRRAAFDLIVPNATVARLIALLKPLPPSARVRLLVPKRGFRDICFQGDGFELLARPIDGHYPDYERIIPGVETATTRVRLPAAALRRTAREMARMVPGRNTTRAARLAPNGAGLELTLALADLGTTIVRHVPGSIEGVPFEAGFNIGYLARITDGLGDEVSLWIRDGASPATISGPGGTNVLMPMRI